MVFLHQQNPSRKRPSSFIPPFPQPKIPKSFITTTKQPPQSQNEAVKDNQASSSSTSSPVDKMVSILADAGCTLINPSGPPCLPSDHHKFRNHLNRLFSSSDTSPALRSDFLSGFFSYINPQQNFRRRGRNELTIFSGPSAIVRLNSWSDVVAACVQYRFICSFQQALHFRKSAMEDRVGWSSDSLLFKAFNHGIWPPKDNPA